MNYLFDPDNWEWLTTGNNVRFILEGFLINLEIALVSMVFALIFGLLLALLRLSRLKPVSIVAGAWIDVFRNLPLIFLILYFALGLPASWKQAWEDAMPSWAPEAFQSGLVLGALMGLILYNSAVLAEIMRAGILSLPRGQGEASSALGMSYGQSLRYVILPQGLRRMVPATVSQLITLEQGHDAGLDHRHHGGHATSADRHRVELLHRGRGADPAGLHLRRLPVRGRQLRALPALAPAGAARAQDHRHQDEERARPRGPGRDRSRIASRR